MHRALLALAVAVAALVILAPDALACSRDDHFYFDAFPDATCLLSQSATEIDALGGLRLATDGDLVTEKWDTPTEFATALDDTLAVTGPNDATATMQLAPTGLPLTGNAGVLAPPQ